jgi:hypothetical protein
VVLGVVDPVVFLVEVVVPVGVVVTVGDQGPEGENCLGSVKAPAGSGDVHSVFDDVAAGSFDDAGGDRPSAGEGCAVVRVGLLAGQVGGYLIGAFAFGG